jgi:hypothetical protein
MDKAPDNKALSGSDIPFPFQSEIGSRLTMQDIAYYNLGERKSDAELGSVKFDHLNPSHYHVVPKLNKLGKIPNRTSWDSFAYALMMGHNVECHIVAVQRAQQLMDIEIAKTNGKVHWKHWKKVKSQDMSDEYSDWVPRNILYFNTFIEDLFNTKTKAEASEKPKAEATVEKSKETAKPKAVETVKEATEPKKKQDPAPSLDAVDKSIKGKVAEIDPNGRWAKLKDGKIVDPDFPNDADSNNSAAAAYKMSQKAGKVESKGNQTGDQMSPKKTTGKTETGKNVDGAIIEKGTADTKEKVQVNVPPPTVINQGGGGSQTPPQITFPGGVGNVRTNDSTWQRFQDRRAVG